MIALAFGGGAQVLLTRESFFAGALGITWFASLLFPGRSCSTSASSSWPGRSRADRAVRGEMGGPLLPFREPRHHRRLGCSIQRRAPTAGRPGLHAAALGGPRRLPHRPRGITIATIVWTSAYFRQCDAARGGDAKEYLYPWTQTPAKSKPVAYENLNSSRRRAAAPYPRRVPRADAQPPTPGGRRKPAPRRTQFVRRPSPRSSQIVRRCPAPASARCVRAED